MRAMRPVRTLSISGIIFMIFWGVVVSDGQYVEGGPTQIVARPLDRIEGGGVFCCTIRKRVGHTMGGGGGGGCGQNYSQSTVKQPHRPADL